MIRSRWTICLVGCWALVAAPALCSGGLLPHPCDCEESTGHQHGAWDECGHEGECAADPCGIVVTRLDDDSASLPFGPTSVLALRPSTALEQSSFIEPPARWRQSTSALSLSATGFAVASTILLI